MKTNFLIIVLSIMVSSLYAHADFCPEADLSEAQETQRKELMRGFISSLRGLSKAERKTQWEGFQQTLLDTIDGIDEDQRVALSECFKHRKERRHGRRHKCFEEAGFSNEQKDQWKTLREEFKASVEGLSKEERRAKRAEFRQHALDIVPATLDQRTILEQCFEKQKEHRKKRGEQHE